VREMVACADEYVSSSSHEFHVINGHWLCLNLPHDARDLCGVRSAPDAFTTLYTRRVSQVQVSECGRFSNLSYICVSHTAPTGNHPIRYSSSKQRRVIL